MLQEKKAKKEKKEEIDWDKKKIILFSFVGIVLLVLAINFKPLILGEKYEKPAQTNFPQVKEISTKDLSNGIKQSIESNINNLKNQASDLDVAEIASSSPQVQKILNDLRSIKDLPKNQVKSTCEKICSGL